MATDLDQLDEDEIEATFKLWGQGKVQKVIRALGEAVLSPRHAIAVTKHLLETKAQNSEAHGFWTRWLIRAGIFQSLGGRLVSGRIEFDDRWWTYDDLKQTWWYKWACEHKDAVNSSDLGARIKGDAPTNKEIGMWIRAMGILLSSKQIDAHKLDEQVYQKNESATDLPCISLKNKKVGLLL
ncbi:MAG: hypothetical protein ABFS56_26365 [Pseudomonadota bacterium]